MYNACPVCDLPEKIDLVSIESMPVYCNILHDTKDKATSAVVGNIELVLCENCSHIYNASFDPSKMDYSVDYENSLHYSKVFSEYTETLATGLVDKYQLKEKNIVEIGCGKGDFLEAICAKGNNKGFGFDKSFDFARFDKQAHPHVTFYQEFYDERYTDLSYDFLCSRHVLEHIQYPTRFIENIKEISPSAKSAVVYIEVPNGLFTLRDFGIWDIIYEHCSYFTPCSLAHCFQENNFEISALDEVFDSQFLSMEAQHIKPGSADVSVKKLAGDEKKSVLGMAEAFSGSYKSLYDKWNKLLMGFRDQSKKTVIWGSGSKGVTFLNVFKSLNYIDYAVDLNPHKQNKFLAGPGQQVVSPEFLQNYNPDVVIVMNSIYEDEIRGMMLELGVNAELISM